MGRCDCSKCEGARRQRFTDERPDWLADGSGITALVGMAACVLLAIVAFLLVPVL